MQNITGKVYLVGAGPGDPGLLTLRGKDLLQQADVVIYDRLIDLSLLGYAAWAEKTDVGKKNGQHTIPQDKINEILIDHARKGKIVVRLKGGDPLLFGRGGEEAMALREAGIDFEIVPGVSSALAVPAYAGIPITHRNIARSVTILTGHIMSDGGGNGVDCSIGSDTLIFLMGVANLEHIVDDLLAAGKSKDTPVAIVQQGTTACQKTVVGTLENIVDKAIEIQSPATIVVGKVVELRDEIGWFEIGYKEPIGDKKILFFGPMYRDLAWLNHSRDAMLRELRSKGVTPVFLPTSRIEYAHEIDRNNSMLDTLTPKDGHDEGEHIRLLFSSDHAVHYFFEYCIRKGMKKHSFDSIRIGTTGEEARKALEIYNIIPCWSVDSLDKLEAVVQKGLSSGERILFPCSSTEIEDIPSRLWSSQFPIVPFIIYNDTPFQIQDRDIVELLKSKYDLACFFNSEDAAGLLKLFSGDVQKMARFLKNIPCLCYEPVSFELLTKWGIKCRIYADNSDSWNILQNLEKYL